MTFSQKTTLADLVIYYLAFNIRKVALIDASEQVRSYKCSLGSCLSVSVLKTSCNYTLILLRRIGVACRAVRQDGYLFSPDIRWRRSLSARSHCAAQKVSSVSHRLCLLQCFFWGAVKSASACCLFILFTKPRRRPRRTPRALCHFVCREEKAAHKGGGKNRRRD